MVRLSLTVRLMFEIECLRVLLLEQIASFQVHRKSRIPRYVSLDGCSLDWNYDPDYYNL